MMTAKVPVPIPGQRGYRVNPETGTVHLRYAPHASGLPKTHTPRGVLNLLAGKKPKACQVCEWGTAAPNLEAPVRGQVRRTPTADPSLD